MKLKLLAAAAATLASSGAWAVDLGLDANCAYNGTDMGASGSYRRCDLPADIAVSGTVTLPKAVGGTNIMWTMPSVVTVGNGQLAGKTPSTAVHTVLAIEAGAYLVGAIANSALVITRGAEIDADGTSSEPIVFASIDNNFTGTGEWGGVILSSWDNVNECNTTLGDECAMEGISQGQFYYGGYINESTTAAWDNISSGTMAYVVIAEGGHAVNVDIDGDPDPNSNTGDEINGLTLYGVSSETSIANIHVHNNDDDAIEFFGGDVDAARLWLTCAGDDSVDWDQGYRGDVTFVNIRQKDGADHAFELANNTNNYTATPVSDGNISRVTLTFVNPANVDVPFRLKEGTGGNFSSVEIAGAYTGNCFGDTSDPINQHVVTSSDLTNIEYSCADNANLLGASASITGFTNATFWADYPGNCN